MSEYNQEELQTPEENGQNYWYLDGSVYTGPLKDHLPEGCGRKVFPDGSVYEGDFVRGIETGKGTMTWTSGNTYSGDFVNGVRNGTGVYTMANGDRYEGSFINNQRSGKGKYTWSNGMMYEGELLEGNLEGRGKLTYPNGQVREGIFRKNEFIGEEKPVQKEPEKPLPPAKNAFIFFMGTHLLEAETLLSKMRQISIMKRYNLNIDASMVDFMPDYEEQEGVFVLGPELDFMLDDYEHRYPQRKFVMITADELNREAAESILSRILQAF